ncbi:MAG: LTA synthase family protein [Bacteroidales bacterium]|nr:LTA synthase family protein [Bacteroidales bacterium]
MKKVQDWFRFFAPRYAALTVVVGFIVRLVLMVMPITEINFGVGGFLRIILLGALNDVAFSFVALVPAFLIYTFTAKVKYRSPYSWILGCLLAALTFYVVFFNDITDEYGSAAPRVANALLSVLLVSFLLKLFIPKIRDGWRLAVLGVMMTVYAVLIVLFNLIGEPVFWEEFGVRYNFIAVDYLVYTHEVVGNIVESYPMVPVVLGVLLGAMAICYLMVRGHDIREAGVESAGRWLKNLAVMGVGVCLSVFWLHWSYMKMDSKDMYVTQLQENGCWDFVEAFTSNELDYAKFYPLLPAEEAEAIKDSLVSGADSLTAVAPKNIVLITVESLSAKFLTAYGNTEENITPNLDTLLEKSLVFDRLFATGNRTVRGLEALTLCIPPSSGESIVKRPDNGGLYTTGSILRSLGYSTTYIYGGDSYFDNMKAYFGGNGYDVFDKESYDKKAISFSNIWGTADEDSYREALAIFDAKAASGAPFFGHIMTISNHRPYTYPDGRITFEGDNPNCRRAAVQYTDYAIGDFLAKASTRPWFGNTVFVIIADHCASSAGKTSLPLEGYHIPALIYAPGFIEPQHVGKVCSQIDVFPTLFHILGIPYDNHFYGSDVLSPSFRERAFMATYQDLGYYRDGILTVLSPVRVVSQYSVAPEGEWGYVETPLEVPVDSLSREAQALYQTANLAFGKTSR